MNENNENGRPFCECEGKCRCEPDEMSELTPEEIYDLQTEANERRYFASYDGGYSGE
jgi:hypothetical protein